MKVAKIQGISASSLEKNNLDILYNKKNNSNSMGLAVSNSDFFIKYKNPSFCAMYSVTKATNKVKQPVKKLAENTVAKSQDVVISAYKHRGVKNGDNLISQNINSYKKDPQALKKLLLTQIDLVGLPRIAADPLPKNILDIFNDCPELLASAYKEAIDRYSTPVDIFNFPYYLGAFHIISKDKEAFKKLILTKDGYESTNIAERDDVIFPLILKTFGENSEELEEILFSQGAKSTVAASKMDFATEIFAKFSNNPNTVKKIALTKNSDGYNYMTYSQASARALFEYFKDDKESITTLYEASKPELVKKYQYSLENFKTLFKDYPELIEDFDKECAKILNEKKAKHNVEQSKSVISEIV